MFTWIANLNVTDWKPTKKMHCFFLLQIESAKKTRLKMLFRSKTTICVRFRKVFKAEE